MFAGGRAMSNAVDRLKLAEAVLALIEQKRVETGDETLGAGIERVVLDTQFEELEAEILENPGAIEPLERHSRKGNYEWDEDLRALEASLKILLALQK
jgi:hypothetical protein